MYPKELHELHNHYILALYKIEIKRKILSKYQLTIPEFYNILTGNVKNWVPKFFEKEKYVSS